LNSTDCIAHGSQKANIQTVNSQPVVREASEQMESLWSSQSVWRKITQAENSEPIAFLCRRDKFGTLSNGITSFL
jgi:hypothetical protein